MRTIKNDRRQSSLSTPKLAIFHKRLQNVMSEKCGFQAAMQVCTYSHYRAVEYFSTRVRSPKDVGGGSCKNEEKHSLANASLVWMVNHIIDANVGVLFKLSAFNGEECQGIKPVFRPENPHPNGTIHIPSIIGRAHHFLGNGRGKYL